MSLIHPKTLTSQKLSSCFGLLSLKSFHGFIIIGGRIEPFPCLVFYLVVNMWENLYKKPYQSWQTVLKTFKKHKNIPTTTHKKRQILFQRFLVEYTVFLTSLLFWKGGWKKIGKMREQFFKNWSEQKGNKEKVMGFFHFNFLTISCHGNWHCF